MSKFKSEFFNLMLERGFYNQCTNEDGFDTYLYECESRQTGRRLSRFGSHRRQPARRAYRSADDDALVPEMRA